MLGSVISKRWVVSLALVGLVSLFMASSSAAWANPASASTTVATGQVLTSVVGVTGTGGDSTIAAGDTRSLGVVAKNEDGGTTLEAPITYHWAVDTCGTLSATDTATVTFTADASGGCTAVVSVVVKQGGTGDKNGPSTTFNVNAKPAAAPATVLDVDLDDAQANYNAATVEAYLKNIGLPASVAAAAVGGSKPVTISVDEVSGPISRVPVGTQVRFTSHSTGQVIIVTITAASSSIPGANSYLGAPSSESELGAIAGSSSIDVSIFDVDGNKLENFRLDKPAEVCLPYTDEDLAGAYGGIDGMAVYHYNGADWVKTNSSVDLNNKLVCGYSSTFSPFALGLAEAPPAPAGEAGLPATGDYAPGMSSLILALMAGIALVGTGVFKVRRGRRVRENS